jgi:hypothetical protein
VYVHVPQNLKSEIVDPEETAVARQRLGKHVPATTNTHNTHAIFPMRRLVLLRDVRHKNMIMSAAEL